MKRVTKSKTVATKPGPKTPRIVGLGKFASNAPDLGSNKTHLRDFGR